MYWFGKTLDHHEAPWENNSFWKDLSTKKREFAATSVDSILAVLDSFADSWKEESPHFENALKELRQESGFSPDEIKKTLSLLPAILKRESLEKRIRAEFHPATILDGFHKTPGFSGRMRAMPLGIVLHVTAGNVFLSSIDSLIMGLITKNISLLKVSSQNTFFPLFFAEMLALHDKNKILSDKFAILHWKGGESSIEDLLKKKVDGIIAWGGEEMIESYRRNLPKEVKLLDFGPKVSLQVISQEGLSRKNLALVANSVVEDIIAWDQSACASPQNLFLQEGINEGELLKAIDQAFQDAPRRGEISEDEAVEILKEYYRGLYSEIMNKGVVLKGEEHLLHLEDQKYLRPSPLHRSLIIKRFKDENDLFQNLESFNYYLQSCSYLLGDNEKDNYLTHLCLAGIKRFAPLGTITWGMEGAPHDGRQVLRELTRMIGDEVRIQDFGEKREIITSSKEIKKAFEQTPHPEGYIFSSGGTTGEPKFVHFSYQEFDYITDMLAENFRSQGIKRGMTVANLFVAGNLWSSFMAVEKALEKVGVIQLPIGGLCSDENILMYLKKFKPEVVMGIPSLLVLNAEYAEGHNVELEVPMVFYAGEALSETRRDYLCKTWKTKYFGSAGYASVDAGMIAYQCSFSQPGEHHLFKDLVRMDIIDDEAVVSSLYRTSMPVKNYRTGDKVEWIEKCQCGSSDPRFRLLGRVDNTIHIWSCRINMDDIEKSLRETSHEIKTFQIILNYDRSGDKPIEKMQLIVETALDLDTESLAKIIYHNSRDLKDTIDMNQFQKNFSILTVENGMIRRNPRTGKISQVLDLRR
jgi:phenylacetate-CoA ligase